MNSTKIKDNSYVNDVVDKLECILEITLLTIIYYNIWRNEYDANLFPDFEHRGRYVVMGLYALILIISFIWTEGFLWGYLKRTDVVISQWVSIFIVNFITYWQLSLIANGMIPISPMLMLCVLQFCVALIAAYLFDTIYVMLNSRRQMVMVYGTENALKLKFKANKRLSRYRITKVISIEEDFDSILKQIEEFDAVIINDLPGKHRNNILKHCYWKGIDAYIVPKISDIIIRGAEDFTLLDTPIVVSHGKGLTLTQRMVKRTMDIVLCLIALIPGSIIMIITAIAIKLDDGGPVFFTQDRVTRDGKIFKVIKFRSMIVNADEVVKKKAAVDGDPRITKVGRFIRPTRIDELPQLFNILKGDMSIVGPRPERVEHVRKYSQEVRQWDYREKVKAGLTGYAQIYGRYNTTAYDKLRLDLIYIENYSVVLDLKLIFRTIRVLFQKESTEGFDKAEELEMLTEQELQRLKYDIKDDD
ncbi:MAG: exopolysaccharide biosynthesis polyprenyl glycosylphosphotransferase [Mogibacterium sp.]|nr:exopolysaccharide biosynthesis polyprenyl glycosylphosphotransferase [Mogibacterium sp.]